MLSPTSHIALDDVDGARSSHWNKTFILAITLINIYFKFPVVRWWEEIHTNPTILIDLYCFC